MSLTPQLFNRFMRWVSQGLMHWAAPNCVPVWGQTELQKGMCAEQVFPVPTLSLKWKCQCFRSCVGVWAATALCQSQVQLRQSSICLTLRGSQAHNFQDFWSLVLKVPHTIFTKNPSERMEAFFAVSKSCFCPFVFHLFIFWLVTFLDNMSVFLSCTSVLQRLLLTGTTPLAEH